MEQISNTPLTDGLTSQVGIAPSDQTRQILSELIVNLSAIQSLITGQPIFRRSFASKTYSVRRIRSRFFPEDLFADPAWDILLLLYGVEQSRERLSVSAVAASIGTPQTTALRWIEKLEREGMLIRQKHPTDRRVSLLSLSEECVKRMDRFFDSALSVQLSTCGNR